MTYRFQFQAELAWVFVVGAGLAVLQVLVSFDPTSIDDWQLWAVSLGGAAIRAGAGALVAALTAPKER